MAVQIQLVSQVMYSVEVVNFGFTATCAFAYSSQSVRVQCIVMAFDEVDFSDVHVHELGNAYLKHTWCTVHR